MKQVDEMPKEGQFVAVWTYKGDIWSDTYKWIDGILYEYDNEVDDFSILAPQIYSGFYSDKNAKFFVVS